MVQACTRLCCLTMRRSGFGTGWRSADLLQPLLNKCALCGFSEGPPEVEAHDSSWGGSVAYQRGKPACSMGQVHGETRISGKGGTTSVSASEPVPQSCIYSQCREQAFARHNPSHPKAAWNMSNELLAVWLAQIQASVRLALLGNNPLQFLCFCALHCLSPELLHDVPVRFCQWQNSSTFLAIRHCGLSEQSDGACSNHQYLKALFQG